MLDLALSKDLDPGYAVLSPDWVDGNATTELANVAARCGQLTPPEDAVAMAEPVRKLGYNAKIRETLVAAARQYAMAQLHLDAVLGAAERESWRLRSTRAGERQRGRGRVRGMFEGRCVPNLARALAGAAHHGQRRLAQPFLISR